MASLFTLLFICIFVVLLDAGVNVFMVFIDVGVSTDFSCLKEKWWDIFYIKNWIWNGGLVLCLLAVLQWDCILGAEETNQCMVIRSRANWLSLFLIKLLNILFFCFLLLTLKHWGHKLLQAAWQGEVQLGVIHLLMAPTSSPWMVSLSGFKWILKSMGNMQSPASEVVRLWRSVVVKNSEIGLFIISQEYQVSHYEKQDFGLRCQPADLFYVLISVPTKLFFNSFKQEWST